ncbi:unnamed protein product [Rotaria socialis]|uniref:Uncharacterized protein n=2 Tax=Rotaria socialis TaxID=392032 RepID=A0A818UQ58_9BILA|nr:unnamed protein product [Rotaria socialis]
MCLLIGFIIILYVSYRLYQHFYPTPNISPNGKYILISGCDTGFGHGLAIELDRQGFNVLALSSRASVFRLDITKQDDIDAAFELVKEKTQVLHGLVNNAGIAVISYIDWTSMESYRQIMDVNFFGHVGMTKKFLPLLIAKRDSRVVNICSAAGYIATPAMSAYSASKYALESFSDCLRREMVPWGLRVSIIEPGFMRTPMLQDDGKSFSRIWDNLSRDAKDRWGEEFVKAKLNFVINGSLVKKAEDPMKVVRALQHAIMSSTPHIRYRPGIQSAYVSFPMSTLPAWLTDWILRKLRGSNHIPVGISKQHHD